MALPVVALPGFVGSVAELGPLVPALPERELHLFALPPGPPLAAGRALAGRFEALGRAHVVTGSYGGLVLTGVPSRCIASWVAIGTAPDRAAVQSARPLARALAWLPDRAVERLYRKRLQRRLRADGVPEHVARAVLDDLPDAAVLRGRLAGVLAWEVGPWPDAPTLWLAGRADLESDWSEDRIRAGLAPHAVERVDGGHRPHASHPEALARRLRIWWSEWETGTP